MKSTEADLYLEELFRTTAQVRIYLNDIQVKEALLVKPKNHQHMIQQVNDLLGKDNWDRFEVIRRV